MRGLNLDPAVAQAGANPDACELRALCVTSSADGRLRTPPEPRSDGATYDPRASNAVHIVPPDVADVVSVVTRGATRAKPPTPRASGGGCERIFTPLERLC